MSGAANYVIEATIGMILLTLVVMHAQAFGTVVAAGVTAFTGATHALEGPQ